VLGNGKDDSTTWFGAAAEFGENLFVLVDVFEDIKRPDNVEFRIKWHVPCVHLKKLDARKPFLRESQTFRKDVCARHPQIWKSPTYTCQNEARAAADLEENASGSKIMFQGPLQQQVTSTEPEMIRFKPAQLGEIVRGEALISGGELTREAKKSGS